MAPATTSAALAVLPSIRIASLGAPATAVPSATRVCGGSVMLWVDTITPWSMNTRAVATASFSRPPRLPRRSRITPRVWSAAARFTSRRMSWADPSTKAGTRMYSNRWPPLPIRRAVTRVTRTGWRSSVSSSGAAAPGVDRELHRRARVAVHQADRIAIGNAFQVGLVDRGDHVTGLDPRPVGRQAGQQRPDDQPVAATRQRQSDAAVSAFLRLHQVAVCERGRGSPCRDRPVPSARPAWSAPGRSPAAAERSSGARAPPERVPAAAGDPGWPAAPERRSSGRAARSPLRMPFRFATATAMTIGAETPHVRETDCTPVASGWGNAAGSRQKGGGEARPSGSGGASCPTPKAPSTAPNAASAKARAITPPGNRLAGSASPLLILASAPCRRPPGGGAGQGAQDPAACPRA